MAKRTYIQRAEKFKMTGVIFYLKHRVKDVIEFIKRAVNCDDIFTIKNKGEKIRLYLPNRKDLLQQIIIAKSNFYEHKALLKIKEYVKPNSVILDIGSNIGNHSVFFGKILKAKELYCFEPQKEVFKTLIKNLKLNKLSNISKCYNIGIGAEKSKSNIFIKDKNNLGGGRLIREKTGIIDIMPLDDVEISSKVDFIKIDTEGYERDVLTGAEKILRRDNPIIFIEITDNLEYINEYLSNLGYILKEDLGAWNYIFINKTSDRYVDGEKRDLSKLPKDKRNIHQTKLGEDR